MSIGLDKCKHGVEVKEEVVYRWVSIEFKIGWVCYGCHVANGWWKLWVCDEKLVMPTCKANKKGEEGKKRGLATKIEAWIWEAAELW